jgi:hypothetical protein
VLVQVEWARAASHALLAVALLELLATARAWVVSAGRSEQLIARTVTKRATGSLAGN